jgi:hypothetical protein
VDSSVQADDAAATQTLMLQVRIARIT